ncbi:MFS transporter [Streptomyces sp. NY05-11A]|uniref:MFS transporter n=1 Tax=Streptomyces soliscabiei TaxID=588897 RepID=UPI0029A9A98C|nr:MFS transporter [Streptomyces sp. NY05-11A]MDX2680473.1 MFS transporter [Streptomyces sp. NY05-11A]
MSVHTSKVPATRPLSAAPGRSTVRAGTALALLAGCNAMVLLDESMVQIALPGMSQGLGLTPVGLGWVVNAYLLTFGGLLLLGGRMGDLLGRRRVFLAGVALFTVAAALRGAATSGEFLIAVRAVQGIGSALAAPSALALVLSMFGEESARKRAIALYMAVGAASTAGGLLLAGTFSSLGSWQWMLLLNVPLGLLILLLAPLVIEETAPSRGRFDLAGALVSTLGAVALVFGLTRAAEHPWTDLTVVGPLLAGAALLLLFLRIERRARQPIVVLRLFADRNRTWAFTATFAVQGALIGTGFFLVQFLQQFAGYSPLLSAAALTPVAAAMMTMSAAAVWLERRLGPRTLLLTGAALLIASNVWLSRLTPDFGYGADVLPALLLFGTGMAWCVVPSAILATSGLHSDEAGAASSVHNTLQTLGASLGLALLVTVGTQAGHSAQQSVPDGASPEEALGQVFVHSMSASFLAGAVFAAAAFVVALFIRPSGGAAAHTTHS